MAPTVADPQSNSAIQALSEKAPEQLERFKLLYHTLDADSVSPALLATCYHPDIIFKDPFHRIKGLAQLTQYFAGVYENAQDVSFDFHREWHNKTNDGQFSYIRWTMSYRHPKLYGGEQAILVDGGTELSWQDRRIIYHRDFFDAGQMLYEHLPLLRWAIQKLKERMA